MTFALNLSENVFEVIGNYPVVDQFDISYPNLLTGSMYDHYVTGSMIPSNGSTAYRGRVFSKLGVDPQTLPSPKKTLRQSSEYQPFREKANFVKILRIFSDSERIYDSIPPILEQALSKLGVGVIYAASGSGEFAYSYVPDGWNSRFPFEPRFGGVIRSKNFTKFVAYDQNGSKPKPFSKIQVIDSLFQEDGAAGFLTFEWSDSNALPEVGSYDGAKATDILKVYFGFGDSSYRQNGYSKLSGSLPGRPLSTHRPTYRHFDARDASINIAISPVIRGWKYGLYSALPHYTSAVFRRDRYGQLRDMLEQRQVVLSRADSVYSPTNYFGDEESPLISKTSNQKITKVPAKKMGLIQNPAEDSVDDFVVKVSFLQQVLVNVPPKNSLNLVYNNEIPINTWSSNLSTYATSSMPYFDGKQTNRPDNVLVPPAVV
jgi:hypothetical protein